MDESEAIYMVVIGVGALIGVITPIIKLNTSIVKLTTVMEHLVEDDKKQDKRLNSHSRQLDNHEERIIKLEK